MDRPKQWTLRSPRHHLLHPSPFLSPSGLPCHAMFALQRASASGTSPSPSLSRPGDCFKKEPAPCGPKNVLQSWRVTPRTVLCRGTTGTVYRGVVAQSLLLRSVKLWHYSGFQGYLRRRTVGVPVDLEHDLLQLLWTSGTSCLYFGFVCALVRVCVRVCFIKTKRWNTRPFITTLKKVSATSFIYVHLNLWSLCKRTLTHFDEKSEWTF